MAAPHKPNLVLFLPDQQRADTLACYGGVNVRAPNLKKLAKVYANMTPEGAAAIMKQMEDDQIAKFMVFMKEGETAPLLEGLSKMGEPEAKRAAAISERLRTAIFRPSAAKGNGQ